MSVYEDGTANEARAQQTHISLLRLQIFISQPVFVVNRLIRGSSGQVCFIQGAFGGQQQCSHLSPSLWWEGAGFHLFFQPRRLRCLSCLYSHGEIRSYIRAPVTAVISVLLVFSGNNIQTVRQQPAGQVTCCCTKCCLLAAETYTSCVLMSLLYKYCNFC